MTVPGTTGQPAPAPQANQGAPNPAATGNTPEGGAPARGERPRDHRSVTARANEIRDARLSREGGAGDEGAAGAPGTGAPPEGTQVPAEAAKPPATAAEKADLASRLARAERTASEENRKRIAAEKILQEAQSTGTASAKELADLKAKLAAWESDPNKAFVDLKMDLRGIADSINQGKLKPPTPEQKAQEAQTAEQKALQDRIDALEKREREADERDQAKAKQAQFQQRVTQLSEEIKEAAADYPGIACLPWAAELLLEKADKSPDDPEAIEKEAAILEKAVLADARAMLVSPGFLKVLLQDEEIKKQLTAALGPAAAPSPAPSGKILNTPNRTQPSQRETHRPSGGNGPTTLTNQASAAVGNRGRQKPTEEQRKAAVTERAKTMFNVR